MLKKLSVLTLIGSVALTSCQTFNLADVDPTTQGTPMGSVRLGKKNKDFFVIPGKPITPAQMRGDVPVPPSNIVVFKTRERQPHYKAMRVAGAPVRGIRKTFSMAFEKFADLAFGWLKRDKRPADQPATLATESIAYPASMLPNQFAGNGAIGGHVGPQAAHVFHTPQTNRNGG